MCNNKNHYILPLPINSIVKAIKFSYEMLYSALWYFYGELANKTLPNLSGICQEFFCQYTSQANLSP